MRVPWRLRLVRTNGSSDKSPILDSAGPCVGGPELPGSQVKSQSQAWSEKDRRPPILPRAILACTSRGLMSLSSHSRR